MSNAFQSIRDNISPQHSGIKSTSQWRGRKGTYNLYKQEKQLNTSFSSIQPKAKLMSRNISHGDIRAHIRRNPEVPGLKYNFKDDYEAGINKSALYDQKYDIKQKQTYKPLRRQYEKLSKYQYDQPLKSNRYSPNPITSQNKYMSSQLDGLKVERKPYIKPYIKPSPTKSPGKIVQVKNKGDKSLAPQIKEFSLGQRYPYYDRMEKRQLTQNNSFTNLQYQRLDERKKRPFQSFNDQKGDLFDRIENYERKYKQRQHNTGINAYKRYQQADSAYSTKRQYLKPSQPFANLKKTFQDKYQSQNQVKNNLKVRDQNLQNTLRRNVQKSIQERISIQKESMQSKKYDIENTYVKKDRNTSYNMPASINYRGLSEKTLNNAGITPTKLKYKQNDRDYSIERNPNLNSKQRDIKNYSKDKKNKYQDNVYQKWNNSQKQSHQQRFTRLNDYQNRLYDQPKRQRIQSTTDLKIPHKYPYIEGMKSSIYAQQRPQYKQFISRENYRKPMEIPKSNLIRRQQSFEISLKNHPEYNCVNRIEVLNSKINSKFNSLVSSYQH